MTHRALISPSETEALRGGGRVGKVVAELIDFYSRFHLKMYPDLGGAPMHDAVAVAHVAFPDLVTVRDAWITIDCGWEQGRGRTNVDWRGRDGSPSPNAKVALEIDSGRFSRTVVERLISLG